MRNKRKNDILSQMAERDLASFLPLCGEADKKFFDPSCKGREAEEYVRLTLIATALGRRGVVVYLLGEAEYESKDDEVMRCLASVKNDYRTVVNWIGKPPRNCGMRRKKASVKRNLTSPV